MNHLTEMFFAPEEAEKLRVVEKIDIARLRELAEAERENLIDIRPNCEKCKHYFQHYSLDPCYQCKGQTGIGEKGWCFAPRALAEKGDADGK